MSDRHQAADSGDSAPAESGLDQDRHARFRDRYGPWALIIGGAEGLGEAMAESLAQYQLHLCLVDRQGTKLKALADRLQRRHGIAVKTIEADLVDPSAPEAVREQLSDVTIGLVVYIAAVVPIGPFVDRPVHEHLAALAVNCRAPVTLLHDLLPAMVDRGRGGVIVFSSMAGFQGSAHISTYAASKAFLLALAEGLAAELTPRGLDVVVSCPGATRTPAFVRSEPAVLPQPVMSPAAVVDETLRALRRRTVVVPGLLNRMARVFMSIVGRGRAVKIFSRATQRMYPASKPPA